MFPSSPNCYLEFSKNFLCISLTIRTDRYREFFKQWTPRNFRCCEFGKITRFENFGRMIKRFSILGLYRKCHYLSSCTDCRLLIRVTLVLWIMEGTILSGGLCDFLRYIKKNKGILASNWLGQILPNLHKVWYMWGLKDVGAVKINCAVFRDVTACTCNVVDRQLLVLLFYLEHGSIVFNRRFGVDIPN